MVFKNAKQLLGEMIASARAYAEGLPDPTRRLTDWSIGTPQWTLLHAVAIELSRLWLALKRAYHSLFVALALEEDLSLRAMDYGTARGTATAASVSLRVYVTSGTYPVTFAIGLRAATQMGVVFATTESVVVASLPPVGYVDIAAVAETGGASSNARQKTITTRLGTWPSVVTRLENPIAATGGADYESDDLLRARLAQRWKLAAKGVSDCYLAWLQEADASTVTRVLTRPKTNLGEVSVVVVQNNGALYSGSDLTAMEELINGVEPLRLESKVPLHETADVVNIAFTTVAVYAEVNFAAGYDIVAVKEDILDTLANYLDWSTWDWGTDVYRSAMLSLIQSVDGVVSVNPNNFTLNGALTDVTVAYNSLPKLGAVTLDGTYGQNW